MISLHPLVPVVSRQRVKPVLNLLRFGSSPKIQPMPDLPKNARYLLSEQWSPFRIEAYSSSTQYNRDHLVRRRYIGWDDQKQQFMLYTDVIEASSHFKGMSSLKPGKTVEVTFTQTLPDKIGIEGIIVDQEHQRLILPNGHMIAGPEKPQVNALTSCFNPA